MGGCGQAWPGQQCGQVCGAETRVCPMSWCLASIHSALFKIICYCLLEKGRERHGETKTSAASPGDRAQNPDTHPDRDLLVHGPRSVTEPAQPASALF